MCSQDDKLTRSSDDLTIDNLDEETLDQALALPHPTEETVDRVEWNAEAEGYTPLADANMNAFAGGMFMTMPPAEEGDTGVFFADMSAFPSSPYATITQYDDDDSDDDNSNDNPDPTLATLRDAVKQQTKKNKQDRQAKRRKTS